MSMELRRALGASKRRGEELGRDIVLVLLVGVDCVDPPVSVVGCAMSLKGS